MLFQQWLETEWQQAWGMTISIVETTIIHCSEHVCTWYFPVSEITLIIVEMTMSENKLIRIHSFDRKRTNVIFVSTILFRNTIQIWSINMRISCGLNSSKTYMKERLIFKFLNARGQCSECHLTPSHAGLVEKWCIPMTHQQFEFYRIYHGTNGNPREYCQWTQSKGISVSCTS